ncbi:hypothetical protein [Citricoccus sp. CH26A]|uniref:hypothetical protein n=1 Tax=Citricoccus zhacaiensis TaxID=489142 RepID=UPI00114533B2
MAFLEAVGIFSERFFFFAKRVEPDLRGEDLRRAFFRNELSKTRALPEVLINDCPAAGRRTRTGVAPALTRASVEGAVYGAIYLDFASRVGLREAVGLVLDSNAASFSELQTYIHGRGNPQWTNAIDEVETTWEMNRA